MISIHGLTRSFGDNLVLDDVSFDIAPGRMTGFVGANGAGKTTTMRIILGVLDADAGRIEVDGSPITAAYRSTIGYMPEERGLYPKMPIIDQLVYLGRLHGLSKQHALARGKDLLERLGLGERQKEKLEALSLGNQQRAQIAAALVHEPAALILDEPFSGLDPMAVETTLEVLRDVAKTGAPVLFSSHQLDVVERLCDELVIIGGGKVRASGTREAIRAAHSRPEWELVTNADVGWVRGLPGIEVIEHAAGTALFSATDDHAADAVLRGALERGTVIRFSPTVRPLTEIFQEVIR